MCVCACVSTHIPNQCGAANALYMYTDLSAVCHNNMRSSQVYIQLKIFLRIFLQTGESAYHFVIKTVTDLLFAVLGRASPTKHIQTEWQYYCSARLQQ